MVGEKALEAKALTRPEIVILNLGMPNINGYQVCPRLRAWLALSDAMIIALTGYGEKVPLTLPRDCAARISVQRTGCAK